MNKELHFSQDLRMELQKGVKKLADAVKITMGPKGRNALIQDNNRYFITKDGVQVAQSINLENPIENAGAQLIKEVSEKTVNETGDGTTTATVLASAIFNEGLKSVTAGSDPIEIKRGMDKTLKVILENLKKNSKQIENKDDIKKVATISANSDEEIGDLISEAMEKVGTDGIITVEEAKGINNELEIVDGTKFDRGYLSPHFVTDKDKQVAELENPYILFTTSRINNLKDLLPILSQVQETRRPLLIVAEDVDGEALSTLVVNKIRGILDVTAVKAPGFGERKQDILEDLATVTGAEVVSEKTGKSLELMTLEQLGEAQKVTIDKESTIIVNGNGEKEDIDNRIKEIKTLIETSDNDFNIEKLKDRISKLNGGVAVIKVGSSSETELKEKKDRVDDALGATKSAVEEGIVIGGGCALLKASKKVNLKLKGDQKIGQDILLRAIREPLKQIVTNAGLDSGIIVEKVLKSTTNKGFNVISERYVDMFKEGIIDPLKVERVALTNAISVSSLLLTTEVSITNLIEK